MPIHLAYDQFNIACSVHVFNRLVEAAKSSLPEREFVQILKHVTKVNPDYVSADLEAIRHRQINRAKQRQLDKTDLVHYRNLVKHYCGKTVYVKDAYGSRQVTIHGPAHNPRGTKRSGYIEIIDDAWFRISRVDTSVYSTLNMYGARRVIRSKGSFTVRIVNASELLIENPYQE